MIFKEKYFFLSTFYECKLSVEEDGKVYSFNNVESAFQAFKNKKLLDKFTFTKGLEAKKLSDKIKITTPNWETEQLYIMGRLLHIKFSNKVLFFQLKLIEDEEIINDNYWYDTFWGVCKKEGKNILGKMLTNIRDNNNDLEILNSYIKNTLIPLSLN